MNLGELEGSIQAATSLDLTSILPDGNIKGFYQSLTNNSGLVLNIEQVQPTRDAEGNLVSLQLTGSTSLAGFGGVQAQMELQEADDALYSTLTVSLNDRLEFPGFSQFSIEDMQLVFSVSDTTLPLRVEASGTLSLFADIRLSMTYPAINNQWVLRGSFVQPKGLLDMAEVMGGGDLVADLPDFLKDTLDFKVHDLEVAYDPAAKKLRQVTLRAVNDSTIEVLPAVFLSHIAVEGSALYSKTQGGKTPILYKVLGGVQIGTTQKLPKNGSFIITARAPDYKLSGTLSDDATISLTEIVDYVLGSESGLPEVSISQLAFSADLKTKAYSFDIAIDSGWALGTAADPEAFALREMRFHVEKSTGSVGGSAGGTLTIAESTAILFASYQSGASWTFNGTLTNLNLQTLIETFIPDVSLPDEVPDLLFETLNLTFSPASGAFSISGKSTATWELPFGASGFGVSTLDFSLSRGASSGTGTTKVRGPFACSLILQVSSPAKIADGLEFRQGRLGFKLEQTSKTWSLEGSLTALFFDTTVTLGASLQETPTLRTVKLQTTLAANKPLLQIESASLTATDLSVTISKARQVTGSTIPASTPTTPATIPTTATPGSAPVSLSAGSSYGWTVSASGGLHIQSVLDFEGTLVLFKDSEKTGLAFRAKDPNSASATITLPIPNNPVDIRIGFGYISIVKTTQAWNFEAVTNIGFRGLPRSVQAVMADRINGRFVVDNTGVLVAIDRVLAPVELDVPDANLGSTRIDFGKVLLDVSNFMLHMVNGQPVVSADFGFGLPQNLNYIFGTTKQNGKEVAAINFFNTYDPARTVQSVAGWQNDTVTKFRLGFNASTGLVFQPLTSPIKAIQFQGGAGTTTTVNVNLNAYGQLQLVIPNFSFSGTAFAATGGFAQKDLKIPLKPVKELLKVCGLKVISEAIPDGIPIKALHAFDAKGNFLVDDFVKTLGLPNELREPLEFLSSRVEQIPVRLKTTYLNMDIPERFTFFISISPDGSVSFEVKVEGDVPLKMLNSTVGPLGLPMLMGIELRRFKLRMAAGGALMLVKIDANVDFFDILTLAAAVAAPLDKIPFLPDPQTIHNRLIIDNLVMLIFYQAGIPIPVPLFYDQLGFEYLGLEGLAVQAHFSFKPSIEIGQIPAAFTQVERFFKDRNALLDEKQITNTFDLEFVIGATYLQLPEYLGGEVLGTKDGLPPLRPISTLVHVLNAIKTLSVTEMLQAIPLNKRVGAVSVKFACIGANVAWAITAADEFKNVLVTYSGPQLDFVTALKALPAKDQNDMLALAKIGTSTPDPKQGMIILLWGGWNIASMVSFDVRFGLAVAVESGFGCGLAVNGMIGSFMKFYARGLIIINKNNRIKAPTVTSGSSKNGLLTSSDLATLIQQLQTQVNTLNKTQADLFAQMAAKQNQIAAASASLPALKAQLSMLEATSFTKPSGQATTLRNQIKSQEAAIKQLTTDLTTIQQQLPVVQSELKVAQIQLSQIQGQVQTTKTYRVEGDSYIEILGNKVFVASLRADDDHFYLDGKLTLFPPSSPLQIGGEGTLTIDNGGQVYFHSNAAVALNKFNLINAEITVTNNSIRLLGEFLAVKTTFDLYIRNNQYQLEGSLVVSLNLKANVGPVIVPGTKVKLIDTLSLDTGFVAGIAVKLSNSGFSALITGSFKWQGVTLTFPTLTLSVSVSDVTELTNQVIAQIRDKAYDIFGSLFSDVNKYLDYMKQGVISISSDVAEVLQGYYKLTADQTTKALRDLGRTWDQVAGSLRLYYKYTGDQAAQVMKTAGATAQQVGQAMKNAYQLTDEAAARVLKSAYKSATDVGNALQSVYGTSKERAAQIFYNIGYSTTDAANTLKSVFKASANETARYMKDVYKQGDKAVETLLKGAGYVGSEIDGAMKAVFDWGKEVIETVSDPDTWNPSKW